MILSEPVIRKMRHIVTLSVKIQFNIHAVEKTDLQHDRKIVYLRSNIMGTFFCLLDDRLAIFLHRYRVYFLFTQTRPSCTL